MMLPDTTSVISSLETALRAIADQNLEKAITEILSVWQIRRDHTLTDLLNFIDTQLVRKEIAPIEIEGFSNPTEAWLNRASQMNVIDIPILLDFIRQEIAITPSLMILSVKLAKERPADPRIARELLNYIITPPFGGGKGRSYYPELLQCIKSIDDPALYLEIMTLAEQYRETQRVIQALGRKNTPLFYALVEHFKHKPSNILLTKLERDICLQIKQHAEKIIPTDHTADALLKTIYASPDDISARMVYADYLMEKKQDPRGEFIALQCANTKSTLSKREKELLRTHGRRWLGTLEPFLSDSDIIYKNGFLKACKFNHLSDKKSAIAHTQWSTVTDIDISRSTDSIDIILHPVFKSLRRVYGLSREQLSKLCKHIQPLPWTDIDLMSLSIAESSEMLATSSCLNKLVGIEYGECSEDTLFDFLNTPMGQQLTRLRLRNNRMQWSFVRQGVLKRAPKLDVLEYLNSSYNSNYSTKFGHYVYWLISMVGAGALDKIIATYTKPVSPDLVSSFFEETSTIRWQDMSQLIIQTPTLLKSDIQDGITRKCKKYNNRIDIKFLTSPQGNSLSKS